MSVFKSNKVAYLGIGAFVVNSTRRASREGRIKPQPVQSGLTSEEKARLSPEDQWLLTEKRRSTNEQVSLYSAQEDFDKAVQEQLANREGAIRDPKFQNFQDVQFRATDNDAFIRNTLLNVASFESEEQFYRDELFSDQARTVGLFSKEPSQATITIQVGEQAPLVVTNEFVLSSVSEASQEKYQIFQTFDDDFIYFFDRNPHIYTYGGMLVNGAEHGVPASVTTQGTLEGVFEWKNRFQALYENVLRGTKCVENNARAILVYENVVREGFLLNFSLSEDARTPTGIPFNFTFFVTKEVNNHRSRKALPADFIGTGFKSPKGADQ